MRRERRAVGAQSNKQKHTPRFFCRLLSWAAAGCVALSLGGCAKEPQAGMGFRFPLESEPQTLDPQVAADESAKTVIEALFEPLVTAENGTAQPAAADWTVSDDGRVYTFTLYEAAWSDGTAVTADDFRFAYERVCDPATRSPYTALWEGVTEVTADGAVLTVTLAAADSRFLAETAAMWYPCPRAFFAACGGRYGMEAESLLPNGAFTLRAWNHGQSLLLKRNDTWHRADTVSPGTVRFVIGADSGVAALESGAVDVTPLTDEEAATWPHTVTLNDTVEYLWLNTQVTPLNSETVRRCLREGLDWASVSAQTETPTLSYVSPDAICEGGSFSSALTAPGGQPDRAAFSAALAAEGLSACPALTILCEDTAAARTLAQYIAQSWQKNLAVYFSVEAVSAAQLSARVQAGNYHMAIAAVTAGGNRPADALRLFTGSAANGNYARWQNAAFAAALETAQTAAEFRALEQQLADACPAVPLSVVSRRFGLSEEISGVQITPFRTRVKFYGALRVS